MASRITLTTILNRRLLLSTRRLLEGTCVKAGIKCKREFVLSLMETYSNNYDYCGSEEIMKQLVSNALFKYSIKFYLTLEDNL